MEIFGDSMNLNMNNYGFGLTNFVPQNLTPNFELFNLETQLMNNISFPAFNFNTFSFGANNNYSSITTQETIFVENLSQKAVTIPAFTLTQSATGLASPPSESDFTPSPADEVSTQTTITETPRYTSVSERPETRRRTVSSPARYTGALSNYNAEKGAHIADIAMRNAGFVIDPVTKLVTDRTKDPQRFTGTCARYVMTSLTDAGVDDDLPRVPSAYMLADTLRRNSNFEEISASTPLRELPPGTVIVYGRGVAGYSSTHGHVEIITNDGRAVSDAITDNLYRRPSQIFIPV